MGKIKKYHFLLYVTEEQELAVRQLFLINKWELHSRALLQLVDILEAIENEPKHRLADGQKVPKGLPKYQLSGKCQSELVPPPGITRGKKGWHEVAAHELFQNITELEKEAEKSVDNDSSGNDIVKSSIEIEPVQDHTIPSLNSGTTDNLSGTKAIEENISDKEVQTLHCDTTVEVDSVGISTSSSAIVNTSSSAFCNSSLSDPYNVNNIQMDPLAQASEIAGIPYQKPDGSVYFSPDSVESSRFENVHQSNIPLQRSHQQEDRNLMQTGIETRASGIDQLLKASAIVQPPGYLHFSLNSQSYPSQVSYISDHFTGDTEYNDIKSFLQNKITNGKQMNRVREIAANVIEIENASADVKVAEDGHSSEAFGIEYNRNTSDDRQMSTGASDNGTDSAEAMTFEKKNWGSVFKDYVEVQIHGSMVKIPLFKPFEMITTVENSHQNYLGKETNGLPENDANDTETHIESFLETPENDRLDESNLLTELSRKSEKINEEVNTNLNNKQKKRDQVTGKDNGEKSVKLLDPSMNKSIQSEENNRVTNHAKKCQINENEGNKEENCCLDFAEKEKAKVSNVTKCYPKRLKVQKETLATVKNKRKERSNKTIPKSSIKKGNKQNHHSESNRKKRKQRNKNNIISGTKENTQKENETKESVLKNLKPLEQISSKLINVKKMEAEHFPKKESLGTSEENHLEYAKIDNKATDIKARNEETKAEIKNRISLQPKKVKLKKRNIMDVESMQDGKLIIQTQCPKCGKNCTKIGYCKDCQLRCQLCGEVFSQESRELYRSHIRKHHQEDGSKPFHCNECEMKFTSKLFLNRHIKSKHVVKPYGGPIICEICQKRFTTKYGLKAHISHVHGDRKRNVQCDLCGNFFLSEGYLRQHRQYVHQEERNFTCTLCFVSVKTDALLKRHMARHTEEKNEVCQICGRSFRVRSDLLRHMVRHDSNRRSFKCEHCGKGFFEDQKLKQHIRIHTGDKPFSCHLCSYKCAVKGNLTKHLKTHANRDGYSGRVYRKKGREPKVVTEHIAQEHVPVSFRFEVITREQTEQEVPHYAAEGMVQYEDTNHDLQQFEVVKQGMSHYDSTKQELLHYDASKQDLQELPRFDVPYEATTEHLEQDGDQYKAIQTEPIRTESESVRIYYEPVHPSHTEAGRTAYLDHSELKHYKEMTSADGESYLNITAASNNYRPTSVNKIDFYNI